MDKILAILCFLVAAGVIILDFPGGVGAVLVLTFMSVAVAALIRLIKDDTTYLLRIFVIGLLLRSLVGFFINYLELQMFFGGDAFTYDFLGNRLLEVWLGTADMGDFWTIRAVNNMDPGWGMNYVVAVVYLFVGKNLLAGQFFCAVMGAATAPIVYLIAHKLYENVRVARIASCIVAIFPSFLIWSGQLLKDGLIVFLLSVIILMILKLQEKFDYTAIFILIFALFGVLSLRFYIFYMVAIAVTGSFVVGLNNSLPSLIRRVVAIIVLGLSLIYMGVLQRTADEFNEYGNLERVNNSRRDLARGDSGFAKDLDVSTTEGVVVALPIGFIYLMLAPFPWEMSNVRQLITLPEVLVWWAMIPFLISGIWFTVKTRLRSTIAIILFTLLLTLTYSVFQGNVGTAYRQRTQIQLFLFIFISVGISIYLEKQENRRLVAGLKRRHVTERLRAAS